MKKIAIDVVLLPPESIMDKAIEINRSLVDDPIVLNKEKCLPHISLCMGVAKEEDMSLLRNILDKIAEEVPSLELTITGINSKHTAFDIAKTEELKKLQTTIMSKFIPHLTFDATIDICYSPPLVVEKTLYWINNYKEKENYEKFYPHITLGMQNIKKQDLHLPFKVSRLAICHLGNYCTCRKILHEIKLS